MGKHLVVGGLITLGQHQVVVDQQDLAEGAGLADLDVLVGGVDVFEQLLGVCDKIRCGLGAESVILVGDWVGLGDDCLPKARETPKKASRSS